MIAVAVAGSALVLAAIAALAIALKRFITLAITLIAALAVSAPAASAAGSHWCHQGDPPIQASARTSCGFAGNMVTKWVRIGRPHRLVGAYVYSPSTHRNYGVTFTWMDGHVLAVVLPRSADAWTYFDARYL